MQTAIEKLIANIPKEASVLDIGWGGLDGENTTNFLRAHFTKVDGICKDLNAVDRYRAFYPDAESDTVIYGFYPNDMPADKQWDLLVHDTNIEGNLALWTPEGMQKAWSYVKDGGGMITYMMLIDEYGEPETHEKIRAHWAWIMPLVLPPVLRKHVVAMQREERRSYIMWVLLQKPYAN